MIPPDGMASPSALHAARRNTVLTGPLPAMLWHERTQAPFVGERETFGLPTQTGRCRLYRARPILSDAAMTPLHAKTDLNPPILCQGCHPFASPSQPQTVCQGPENWDIQTAYTLPDIRLYCNTTASFCQSNRQIPRFFLCRTTIHIGHQPHLPDCNLACRMV